MLLGSGKEGGTTAVDSASTLLAQARDAGMRAQLARVPFWSGHGFDEARLANILCWAYGRNPQAFQELVGDGTLPRGARRGVRGGVREDGEGVGGAAGALPKGWTLAARATPAPAASDA